MIRIRNITKRFLTPDGSEISILSLAEMDIQSGEEVGIAGPSGTGKTTLLNIIAGILLPTTGSAFVNGVEINRLPEAKRDLFRAQTIGYIFQDFNLIPSLTAKENVMTSMAFGKMFPKKEWDHRAVTLLEQMGLSHRINYRPSHLSGGEKQRVSIARALANHPSVVIADEPTANLDRGNRQIVMDLLRKVYHENDVTLIIATHDQTILDSLGRVVNLALMERQGNEICSSK
ncbi:MAG: ABC transporter ATP-binding protein [Flexilinea sp.]